MDVTALGELLIDFTCTGKASDGYPAVQAHPGGAPANFLAALSSFGAETALIGKLGSAAFGKMLMGSLEKAGISTEGICVADDVFTTLAFVTLDESGNREFSFSRKPGADACLSTDELNLKLIEEAGLFHFGSLSFTDEPARSAACEAVEYARKCGKLISYDPNLRKPLWRSLDEARKQIIWGIERADVVKLSDEEAGFLFGLEPEEAAEHILRNFPVKLVFVSCGDAGCLYRNEKACGKVPALRDIKVMDTTGAGDIFFGSAIWKMLQIAKPPESLDAEELRDIALFATAAAGLSVTRAGGISSVPSYNEVIEKLNK